MRRETPDRLFVDAITAEWSARDLELRCGEQVDTLYFGGGTPSRLDPASIGEIVAAIRGRVPLATDAEITLEANPDDVTAGRAVAWARAGVNRVSLGVQTHDAATLVWMHRTHDVRQPSQAMSALRAAGIHNVSMDLIFALPVALARDWRSDVEQTLALLPTHLSLYGLTVESHTPLSRWVDRGTSVTVPDDRYADEYLMAHELLESAGFEHYEVSNAARRGFRSRHNSVYWSGAPYVGLGPSAHSFGAGIRRWNVREWAAYQAAIERGQSVVAGSEQLGAEAVALEHRYLGLRTTAGLPAREIGETTSDAWANAGWATVDSGVVRLTVEGWLRLDALVAAGGHS